MLWKWRSVSPLEEELPERRAGSRSKGLAGRPGLSAYLLLTACLGGGLDTFDPMLVISHLNI